MKLELIFSRNSDERLESVNYVNIYFFPHPCYYVLVPGADISKAGGVFLPWVLRDDYTYTSHLLRSARYEIPRGGKKERGEKDGERERDIPASRCVKNRAPFYRGIRRFLPDVSSFQRDGTGRHMVRGKSSKASSWNSRIDTLPYNNGILNLILIQKISQKHYL